MKLKNYSAIVILFLICFMTGLSPVLAQGNELVSLLDRITERMDSYPENKDFKVVVVTKNIEMNKQWQPKKTTIIKSIVKTVDSEVNNEILEATETENGKTKDVTQKMIEQTEKQRERVQKNATKEKDENEADNSVTALFPFREDKRTKYNFRKLDDSVIDEKPVYLIEATAKEKDEELYEGKFYIDKKNFDVLRIQVKPSKNPKFVKELDIEMHFEVLPEGYFVPRRSKTRVDGGFFFKRIRMIAEQEYFDYEIMHTDNN